VVVDGRSEAAVAGRGFEGARRATDEENGEHDIACEKAADRADRKSGGRQSLDDLAGPNHDAAVVAIGDVADQHAQHHHREELHQPDQAEIERAAG